jgi:hypothetical protein
MSRIRWIVGYKSPSPLSPWPLWSHFDQIAKAKEKTKVNTDETCSTDIINTIELISVVSLMVGCWLRMLWPSQWLPPSATIVILLFDCSYVD